MAESDGAESADDARERDPQDPRAEPAGMERERPDFPLPPLQPPTFIPRILDDARRLP